MTETEVQLQEFDFKGNRLQAISLDKVINKIIKYIYNNKGVE